MRLIFAHDLNVIIADYSWYAEREDEIDSWSLEAFGYQPRTGMVLTFRQDCDKMWFTLRWN